jgi:sigma-B regulation protein RsbU (phosphoserine phosphatase)
VHLPCGADPVILESLGSPIGLADDVYEERSIRLGAGDRLYLYSDGVPEAMDAAGKPFGETRLMRAIGGGRSESVHQCVESLLTEISQWHGSEKPQDDISILAVEFSVTLGPGKPCVESEASPVANRSRTAQETKVSPVARAEVQLT